MPRSPTNRLRNWVLLLDHLCRRRYLARISRNRRRAYWLRDISVGNRCRVASDRSWNRVYLRPDKGLRRLFILYLRFRLLGGRDILFRRHYRYYLRRIMGYVSTRGHWRICLLEFTMGVIITLRICLTMAIDLKVNWLYLGFIPTRLRVLTFNFH